ncbi:MAG: hypothetical protein HY690_08660 [Chloroflexi bacterium]|nr:hypothetical protein [Chloroflexota bacterium]
MSTTSEPAEIIVPVAQPKPNGPAAAALLAAGIGSLILGLLTTLAEASPAIKAALTWVAAVGPLSGKTGGAVIGWLVVWVVLGFLWRGRDVNFGRVWLVTLLLVGLGFLGTFPIFYELFTVK